MAIDFPDAPGLNDEYTVGSTTWKWDGSKWNLATAPAPTGPTGPTGPAGAAGSSGIGTLVYTTNFTSQNTITLSNIFNQAPNDVYKIYKIIFQINSTDAFNTSTIRAQFLDTGNNPVASGYVTRIAKLGGSYTTAGGNSQTDIQLLDFGYDGGYIELTISNPGTSSTPTILSGSGTSFSSVAVVYDFTGWVYGAYAANAGIRIYHASANLTGSVYVYGL